VRGALTSPARTVRDNKARGRACGLAVSPLPPQGPQHPPPGCVGALPTRREPHRKLSHAFVTRRVHFTALSGGGIPGTAAGGRPTRPGRTRAANRSTRTSCNLSTLCRASSTSTPRLPACTNRPPAASHSARRRSRRSTANPSRASASASPLIVNHTKVSISQTKTCPVSAVAFSRPPPPAPLYRCAVADCLSCRYRIGALPRGSTGRRCRRIRAG
jgi:hypothetical protein